MIELWKTNRYFEQATATARDEFCQRIQASSSMHQGQHFLYGQYVTGANTQSHFSSLVGMTGVNSVTSAVDALTGLANPCKRVFHL